MKKIIAVLLISILLISMIAPAFARPVLQCPYCGVGEFISSSSTPWQQHFDWGLLYEHQYEDCYETIKCTAGTHGPIRHVRNEKWVPVWGEYGII